MVLLPEKYKKSRFFKIRKEPEEEEAEEEVEEEEEAGPEEAAKGPMKEAVREGGAEEGPEEPERLRPSLPAPREPDPLRHIKEEIYRLNGALKTLGDKLDRKEINQEEYEKRSKNLTLMLANLYEKKIKRELGI